MQISLEEYIKNATDEVIEEYRISTIILLAP